MKLFKKTLAFFLSTALLAGLLAVPAMQASAAGETVTRTVSLLDLSDYADGTVLSKENSSSLPLGMAWDSWDDYTGTRSVVQLEDGTKALKLAFDVKVDENGNRTIHTVPNYDFTLDIPAAYRKYLDSVQMTFDNQSVASDGSWGNKNLNYLLSFTDGTDYAKDSDKPIRVESLGEQTAAKKITEMGKVSAWSYEDYAGDFSVKWTDEEKQNINKAVVSVTVPAAADTDAYVLIKEVNILVTGTAEELDAADKEKLNSSTLINDFESGTGSGVVNAEEEGIFAASGKYVLKHYRDKATSWDGDIRVNLDTRVRSYDGISFYLYNPNAANTLKCYLIDSSGCIAQKNFTASKAGNYIKYTVWFDDVGIPTNGGWDSGTTNTGTALTADQIAGLTQIQFRVPDGGAGVSYYFDDFRYEKHSSEPEKEKALDLTEATVALDNGYNDSEEPTASAEGITYSVDGEMARNEDGKATTAYQGWKTAFDVSDISMINANGIEVTAVYNANGENAAVKGSVALVGKDGKMWKWGENPDALTISTQSVSKKFNYTDSCYETWTLHGWSGKNGSFPTATQNSTMQRVEVYIWAPEGAAEGDTVTITGVKILYGGSRVLLADTVTNGTVSVGDNGYTYKSSASVESTGYFFAGEKAVINILPAEGYALVPYSLKLTDSQGKTVDVEREGFRKLNSTSYSFTMPAADVTVDAEFAPETDVLGSVYSSISGSIDDSRLKFDYTVPLKNGKISVEGKEYTPIGYGALVTTYDVLGKYNFWDGFTVEDIENGHCIGALSTNIHISDSEGYYYDKSISAARFNAIIDIPDSMKDTEFAVRAYVEYENADGKTERMYDVPNTASYTYAVFGMTEFAAPAAYTKGVNISGEFDNTAYTASDIMSSKAASDATYEAIKNEGFDHVRLPIMFSAYLDENGSINADYLAAVDAAVLSALRNDLTVVIDLHHYGEIKTDVDGNKATFYSIWNQLAEHYKSYPDRVIFELLNEPNLSEGADSMTAAKLNEIQLQAIENIRAVNSDRIIALAVYANNIPNNLDLLALPENTDNLIVSVHHYTPLAFTHQGLDSYPVGVDFAESGGSAAITSLASTVKAYSDKKNIPVWISEFGVYLGGLGQTDKFDKSDVTAYYKTFSTACADSGIGWCVWEYNNGFGVFDSNNQLKDFVKAGLFPTN